MPHNIGSMFFVGDKPWHDEGAKLEQPANLQIAIDAGQLDWEVKLIPIMTDENPPTHITQRKAVVRTDRPVGNKNRVLGVVHPGFRPLQNREGLKIFDALMGQGRSVYHTGGYLGNGEVIWLLERFPGEIKIQGNDVVEPYLLFSNSHDGSRSIDIRLTTVRVVCQNTLNLALSKNRSQYFFKHSHSGSFASLQTDAGNYFKFVEGELLNVENSFKALASKKLFPREFESYLEKLLPLPKEPLLSLQPSNTALASYETRKENINKMRADISSLYADGYKNGVSNAPADHSLWGALNSVTAFVDHVQKQQGDAYAHIMFGQGDELKHKAYTLAIEMNKV